ncbi:amidohydrolase family protein [Stigmatella sp. ncwal1]|uniref:Amidohydrolase family protein n=1 Tax=Stigmatella ashevillensis TaxID=2995309 RepID=A0ABT5DBF9_9BACT|nr:amidohydrolase family protein [Stigmatella ashevillena]MDC0710450.1 amidohydrolase family protein [Stigmatella ashevillena]
MRKDPRLLWVVMTTSLLVLAGCSREESNVCGDGRVGGEEQCDDGNLTPRDGCSQRCILEEGPPPPRECGNGVREVGEACDDGNTQEGDGCEATCVRTPAKATQCAALQPLASGATCEVTRTGTTGARLFAGVVLQDTGVLQGGQVLVDAQGIIQCAACDCSGEPGAAEATLVSCPQGVISPGLINAHDHITYQGPPSARTDEKYEYRYDWLRGNNQHTPLRNDDSTQTTIRWGELRQVMSGTTSVAGSGGQPGLLRNVDKESETTTGGNQQGLNEPPLYYQTFPLADSSGKVELTEGCGYAQFGFDTLAEIPTNAAYLPHVAEGIKESSRNEFRCMSGAGGRQNLLTRQTAIIHGIALKVEDMAFLAEQGTDLVWSPRSNISLYGDTALVTAYQQMGITIALGTDWLSSGSMNLLRELQCADTFNTTYLSRTFTDEELWRMVTANAAELTDTQEKLGRITRGRVADLAIFRLRGFAASPHRAVITANAEDVVLTMRGGKPLYGDQPLVDALVEEECETLEVCGASRALCLSTEVKEGSYAALALANATQYPLFFCNQTPLNEPSCVPQRASTSTSWPAVVNQSTAYSGQPRSEDLDADGIRDTEDNCPLLFNPIRPLDNGVQADTDGDGVGDVCDLCPLKVGTTDCAVPPADDEDGDGRKNWEDNCPYVANADQSDTDGDGRGDACDACAAANPGAMACNATPYSIKKPSLGTPPLLDHKVTVESMLVTAVETGGFFIQMSPTETMRYQGPDYSGIYVYTDSKPKVVAGDLITVTSAVVKSYYGQMELTEPTVTKISGGHPLPAPVAVTPREVRTGGPRAEALEAVLVEVAGVFVTKVEPSPGPRDSSPAHEFVVDTQRGTDGEAVGLRVNDFVYKLEPLPAVGTKYRFLRGVLNLRNGHTKLEPRGPPDFVAPPPALTVFGPSGQYLRVGQSGGATFPNALSVRMGNTYFEDVTVTLESSSSAVGFAQGGTVTIPMGQRSAWVELVPGAPARDVTLTARVEDSARTATVHVLDTQEPAGLSSLLPQEAVTAAGRSVLYTVKLDRPAPEGSQMTFSVDPPEFGTVFPASVDVPLNALEVRFRFTASETPSVSQGTLTVVRGSETLGTSVSLTSQPLPALSGLSPSTAVLVEPGAVQPFSVTLNAPALYDTPVELAALPDLVDEPFGTVPALAVVPKAEASATFSFTADQVDKVNGRVEAKTEDASFFTQVQVGTALPALISFSPAKSNIVAGRSRTFTVTLDRPALGNTVVALAVEPASGVGTVPATVTVPAGGTTATFDFMAVAEPTVTGAAVTARLGGAALTATVTLVPSLEGLVINEVDYDQTGTDTKEFVEIYNASSRTLPLSRVVLVYVNGLATSLKEYGRKALSPAVELKPGEYLLVGSTALLDTVTSPNVKKIINSSSIQNGDPDAVALYDTALDELVDTLSYGGQVANASLEGTATKFDFQEGAGSTKTLKDVETGSLSRLPNGTDTQRNAEDFRFTTAITPGADNVMSFGP